MLSYIATYPRHTVMGLQTRSYGCMYVLESRSDGIANKSYRVVMLRWAGGILGGFYLLLLLLLFILLYVYVQPYGYDRILAIPPLPVTAKSVYHPFLFLHFCIISPPFLHL